MAYLLPGEKMNSVFPAAYPFYFYVMRAILST